MSLAFTSIYETCLIDCMIFSRDWALLRFHFQFFSRKSCFIWSYQILKVLCLRCCRNLWSTRSHGQQSLKQHNLYTSQVHNVNLIVCASIRFRFISFKASRHRMQYRFHSKMLVSWIEARLSKITDMSNVVGAESKEIACFLHATG